METVYVGGGTTRTVKVLSLPMRDGNEERIERLEKVLDVLSLPMRDGNKYLGSDSRRKTFVLSLPMRDGNRDWSMTFLRLVLFLAYL